MSADSRTLLIDTGTSGERMKLAADILDRCAGVVLLEGVVALPTCAQRSSEHVPYLGE